MYRLLSYELRKVWLRRGFLFAAVMLLLADIFFLWYTNPDDGKSPGLRAYKMFSEDISGMTEAEKSSFVRELKETADGVSFVIRILAMQNGAIGAQFAEQELCENPGLFEAYYDLYESGEYLRYTDSPEAEFAFIDEMYEEERKVAGYDAYLAAVRERADTLGGISVFAPQDGDSFASRNIKKSAEDFASLSSDGIRWAPSKSISAAMENVWTDLCLILLFFLFIGGMITEEKQKMLFCVTRAARFGSGPNIASKLLALLIHCIVSAALLYGSNLLYFALAAGRCDLTASLQSLASYTESCLPISILGYIVLSVITKALVLFASGSLVTAVCIASERVVLPYFCGAALWVISCAQYSFIPAASKAGAAKYLNLYGALRTEALYGGYLNLDLFGSPVSRLTLSLLTTGIVILSGTALSFLLFSRGEAARAGRTVRRATRRFRPHASPFRYEFHKLMAAGHGLLILFVFCFLIGYSTLSRAYTPTAQENYYMSVMLRLEGEPTEEKTALLEAESARFKEAFENIEKIEQLVADGELESDVGGAMKLKWQSIAAFYPEFQRIGQQMRHIEECGGKFIYDTGYLCLFGAMGGDMLREFILLSVGTVLAFGHVMSIEHKSGTWGLLCATARGRRGVIRGKLAVVCSASAVFSALPFVFRWISISRTFPMHGLMFPAQSIPLFRGCPSFMTVGMIVLLKMFLEAAVGVVLALITAGLSGWRKNHAQTIFFGMLFLCAPAVLAALGFTFARNFSLYPLYSLSPHSVFPAK